MKSTGVVRKLDSVGRLVLPIELRKTFDIGDDDALEIYTEDDMIILKKYQNSCLFCEESEELIEYKGKYICERCLELINKKNTDLNLF